MNLIMILKKRKISLQFLGTQVLDFCPNHATDDFVDGYLNFVKIFFEELDVGSEAFLLGNGAYDVDLSLTIDETLKYIDSITEKLQSDQKTEFWLGVLSAAGHSERILTFAYEVHPTNEAA